MERLNGKQHNSFCCMRALANALPAHQHPPGSQLLGTNKLSALVTNDLSGSDPAHFELRVVKEETDTMVTGGEADKV